MRISDWSADVCSSDLCAIASHRHPVAGARQPRCVVRCAATAQEHAAHRLAHARRPGASGERAGIADRTFRSAVPDRTRVGEGKSVSVRVDIVDGGIIKKKNKNTDINTLYNHPY